MFKELAKKIGFPIPELNTFNPSSLGDPLAIKTRWAPVRSGGASFLTHQLVRTGPGRLEFKPSTGARFFYLLFIIIGLGLIIGFSFAAISGNDKEVFVPLLAGAIFTGVGGLMFYMGTTPVVFDKSRGWYWKNRLGPEKSTTHGSAKNFTRLDNIYALQVISEYCRGNKSSFYSYELNLVLNSGRRINVVDHGNVEKLKGDARTLAAFLNKPVWDAT